MNKHMTHYEFHRKLDALEYRGIQEAGLLSIYSIHDEYRCVGWVNTQIEDDIYIASRNPHLVRIVLAYAQTPIAERNARP